MADNSDMDEGTRGYGVGVPRDAFVGRVVQDPGQPPNALLLTGFVGDSAEEGHLRLYADLSLSQYVDVPEEAVLHSEPLPVDQSPLGGSHLWVRSDAKLVPQAAAGQQQAGFLGGQLFQDQMGGAEALGDEPPQITAWVHTLGLCQLVGSAVCLPRTLTGPRCLRPKSILIPCIPPTVVEPHCFKVRWPIIPQWGQPGDFQAQGFAAPPPTPGCQPQGFQQFQGFAAEQPAVSAQCQMSYGPCPTHLLGCPSSSTCPPTDLYGCPRTSTCPPTFMPGCPSTSTCPPTSMLGCPSTSTCPPEAAQAFAAPPTPGCQPEGFAAAQQAAPSQPLLGCTAWLGCGQTTAATVCTQIGCRTYDFGCPRTSTCPPTFMPGCPSTSTCPPTDQFGCPRTSTCPPTFMPGCPSTSTCPPEQAFGVGGAAGQFGQFGQGAQLTIATVCTQIGCQSLGIACTALSGCGCLPMTVGPVVPTRHMQICGGGPVVSAGRCPSAVDACPTRLCGGQFGGNPGF